MFDALKKYTPINWELVANPVNWVIVILMLAFAGLALAYIMPDRATKAENE